MPGHPSGGDHASVNAGAIARAAADLDRRSLASCVPVTRHALSTMEIHPREGAFMDLVAHHRRLFAYNAWANREVLATLDPAASRSARQVRVFAHIVGAEELW